MNKIRVNSIVQDLVPPRLAKWFPNSIAIGVGAIVGCGQTLSSVCGLGCFLSWSWLAPESASEAAELVGAGILAGDGLAGIIQSILEVCNITPPISMSY